MITNFQNPHQYLLDEIYCFTFPDEIDKSEIDKRLSDIVNWLTKSQAQMACQMLHMDFQQRDNVPEYMPLSEATLKQILLTVQKMNMIFSPESYVAH